MGAYQRPAVEPGVHLDEAGTPIPYGVVYGIDGRDPPDSAYEECRHPERFAAVPIVAAALLDHLEGTYAVTRTEASSAAGGRTVTMTPSGAGAVLVVVFTAAEVPGVVLTAGHRFEALWPDCGCDACDESVPDLLDDMEETVLAIVGGGLSEWRSGPDPTSLLVTDGRTVGAPVVPWHVHHRLEGRSDELESSRWGKDEPEATEMPWTPHRWPAWTLRRA